VTRTLPALGITLALGSAACTVPKYYAPQPCDRPDLTGCVIADISVAGANKVPQSDIKEKIGTGETSHALGGVLENVPILSIWDRITVDYEKLDPFVLERDLARVERLYRARGFYEAHARTARVRKTGKERVRVEIVVEEGVPVTVGAVRVEWKDGVKPATKVHDQVLRRAQRGLPKGAPFAETAFEETKKRLARALTDNGYAYASVEAQASVDLVEHRATVVFTADAGPATKFGKISIEGAPDLPRDRLRQAIAIKEGEPYSTAKLDSAQVALSDLRVIGSVDATPELAKDRSVTEIPVVFHLTPTTLKTVKMGFGAEVGNRISAHGLAGWENKNFLGGLRSFTVEAKPGLVFFPYAFPFRKTTDADFALVPEMRLHTALAQPGFIESRTRGSVSADLNMFQLQTTDTLGYIEFATRWGVERDLWDGRIHLGLYANAQVDQPLKLQIPGAEVLSSAGGYHFLAVPFAQSTFALDLRQNAAGKPDPVNPNRGFYATSDLQVAAAGSQDVRFRTELRGYIPITKKVTLAVRVGGGLLHAFGGGLSEPPTPGTPYQALPTSTAGKKDPENAPCFSQATGANDTRNRWLQIMQLRGFNSGGPNANRGYAYGTISPQEIVPGISPLSATAAGTPSNPFKICTPLPVATGGTAMWEASVELRFPIYDKFGMVVFADGSDVRQKAADLAAPFAPHLTTGIGMHYQTPVGPLRLDLGVRIPGAQVLGSSCPIYDPSRAPIADGKNTCDPAVGRNVDGGFLDPKYGQAGSWGVVPITLSLAIGEAF
jgi:outer membrane protein insertion porin family/translocation and assembly module TamA